MSVWRYVGIGLALALVASGSGCCGCCPTQALPTTSFTPGDFPDIPPYPGAQQQTGRDSTVGLATLPFQFLVRDAEWKHYVTGDSPDAVIDWYSVQMPGQGWISAADAAEVEIPIQSGLIFVREDDPAQMAVIMVLPDPQREGQVHILIGRMHIPVKD